MARHYEISRPSQDLVKFVAKSTPASELAALHAPERAADLKKWLWGRHVIDLLQLLPEPLAVPEFLKLLRKLAPRLYSISSSPKAHPGEVHLTVSAVRYETHGRPARAWLRRFLRIALGSRLREGLCATLARLQASDQWRSADDHGRARHRHRAVSRLSGRTKSHGAKGRNWLFFGDQKRDTDFLYEEQLAPGRRTAISPGSTSPSRAIRRRRFMFRTGCWKMPPSSGPGWKRARISMCVVTPRGWPRTWMPRCTRSSNVRW